MGNRIGGAPLLVARFRDAYTRGVRGLSIGILSHGSPLTLWKTLSSYRRNGLFACADEVFIHFNEVSPLDERIARRFGIPYFGSSENIGIGRALTGLVERARHDTFLFLENDWELVENAEVTKRRVGCALQLVRSGEAAVVRLRHRVRHGEPLFQRQCLGAEDQAIPFHLDTMFWIADPSTRFPGHVMKKRLDEEDWFFARARHAGFTNNPCLYTTAFLRDAILPHATGPHIDLESDVNTWWLNDDAIVAAQGPGLFMHSRIDRGKPGLTWLRTLVGVVGKRLGVRRPGRIPVSPEVGGVWRSDL